MVDAGKDLDGVEWHRRGDGIRDRRVAGGQARTGFNVVNVVNRLGDGLLLPEEQPPEDHQSS